NAKRIPGFEKETLRTKVPYFVVGYRGWEQFSTLQAKMEESPDIDCILDIGRAGFVSNMSSGIKYATTSMALFAFIDALQKCSDYIRVASVDMTRYLKE